MLCVILFCTARHIEVVLQNLSPTAHIIHVHGIPFRVINVYNASAWCSLEDVDCFGLPWWAPLEGLNGCPPELRLTGDPFNPNIEGGGYWGCAYNASTDMASQDLETPLQKDSFQLWQRSWAVIRLEANQPGIKYRFAISNFTSQYAWSI